MGFSGSKFRGPFPSLTQLPSPPSSKPLAGGLEAVSPGQLLWPGFHCSAEGSPGYVPPVHLCSLSHRRGRNSRAGGVSDQAGKRTKELRGERGRLGGWQEWKGHFAMEYEVKKGRKVGGRLGVTQGRERSGTGKPGMAAMGSEERK